MKLYGAYPHFGGGRGLDGECRVHNNPVSLRALNPRERSFPNAAAGRSSSDVSERRRVDHGGGRHFCPGGARATPLSESGRTGDREMSRQAKASECVEFTPEMIEAGVYALSGYGCGELGPTIDLAGIAADVFRAMVDSDSREPSSSGVHSPTARLSRHGTPEIR